MNTSKTRKRKKRKLINRSTICLLTFVLGLSTTSVTLARFAPEPVRDVFDFLDSQTDDPGIEAINQTLNTVDDYLGQAEEFYRKIKNKNLTGILAQIESVLGQLGIISPRDYPGEIIQPDGTLKTPEQIYEQQQILTDTANSDQIWIITDSVLGKNEGEGQERLQKMSQLSTEGSKATINAQERSVKESQKSGSTSVSALTASSATEKLFQQAQKRKVSQDVLKDVAAQQSEIAKSNSAISNQLATLSNQTAIAAGQLSALAIQSQVANEHLTQLQIGQSLSNIQLHDIFNAQRHANQQNVMERQKNAQLAVGATDAIYFPGFLNQQK